MNVLLSLSEERWRVILDVAERSKQDPATVLFRALELGWPFLLRELRQLPRSPRKLHVVE